MQSKKADNKKITGYYIETSNNEDEAESVKTNDQKTDGNNNDKPVDTQALQTNDNNDTQMAKTSAPKTTTDDDDDDDDDKDNDVEANTESEYPDIEDNKVENNDEDEDEDADIKGHEVETDAKIHITARIAKHSSSSNPIENAINDSVYDDVEDGDQSGKYYVHAMDIIKNDNGNPMADIEPNNRVNVYGKVIEEISSYKAMATNNNTTFSSNATQINLGATWGKKTKNGSETKLMLFGSFIQNIDKTTVQNELNSTNISQEDENVENDNEESSSYNTQENIEKTDITSEEPITPETQTIKNKNYDLRVFGAAEHTFANKDRLSGSFLFYDDSSNASTLKVTGKYNSNKYDAYAKTDVNVYYDKPDIGETRGKTTVVTNLKVGLNSDAEDPEQNQPNIENPEPIPENNNDNNENNQQQNTLPERNNNTQKKWKTISNPYVITKTIAGEPSTGLGFE